MSSTEENGEANNPPSFKSPFGKILDLSKEKKNPVELFNGVTSIVFGSVWMTLVLGLSTAIPITMIIIGSIYRDNCPVESYIPIWLIVSGSVATVSALISLVAKMREIYLKRHNNEERKSKLIHLKHILDLFLLAWFIAGNVWVYRIYTTVELDNVLSSNYCQRTCYLFSFWVITVSYILIGLACLCCCITLPVLLGIGICCAVSQE